MGNIGRLTTGKLLEELNVTQLADSNKPITNNSLQGLVKLLAKHITPRPSHEQGAVAKRRAEIIKRYKMGESARSISVSLGYKNPSRVYQILRGVKRVTKTE